MISEPLRLAAGIATIPCVMLDMASHAIQQRQRRLAGLDTSDGFGVIPTFLGILGFNLALCLGFCALYDALWAGSGRAFVYGGMAWLLIAVPMLLMSRFMDDLQQRHLTVRILSWLFKAAAASASLAYFIG